MKLVPDQEALRDECYHPSGQFVEFPIADIEASIPECFEKIVRKFPERLAVKDRNRNFTYKELNQAANRIAHSIVEQSATSERPIALLFEQGVFVIAAILGVLKTGRIYVPLDPSVPAARISVMLQDSQAELLLTNSQNLFQAGQLAQDGQQIINCDDVDTTEMAVENLGRKIVATTPALILYTSGSTGKPKGVLHSHRNILVEASNYINDVRRCPEDALSLCQSCSFANSIRNSYGALLSGAALFPYDLASRGIPPLAEWMHVHRITIFHTLETIIRRLLDTIAADTTFPALRILRFGGEPSSGRDVKSFQRRFAPNCTRLTNHSNSTSAREGIMQVHRGFLLLLSFVLLGLDCDWAAAEKIHVASSSPSLTARLPHMVAHQEGFFTREGLEVESIVVRNDATILAALAAGEFTFVETGAPPAVAAISKGLPFVIIGGFRSRLDYVLMGRKGLSTSKDLKGAKIGVTGAGGLSEAVAIAAMKKLGFQRDKDYTMLYVGNSPLRMIALEQGRVDASIFSPQQQIVLASKGYPLLTDVGRLLPEVPALILSAMREKTKSNPEQAVRFLRAMQQAMNLIRNDPDRALEDARKQRYSGDFKMEREALKYYYDAYSIVFGAANLESLIELSGLKTAMKPAEFFDASLAAKAQH